MNGEYYENTRLLFEKTGKLLLPSIHDCTSKDSWISYAILLLEGLSFLSTKTEVWFAWFVENRLEAMPENPVKEFVLAKKTYDYLENYFFECSHSNYWLCGTIKYEHRGKNEVNPFDDACQEKFSKDVERGKDVRKTTYASHVMWELSRLRVIVNARKMRDWNKDAEAKHFPTLLKDDFIRDLDGPILRYTQSEVRQCLYKMCRRLQSRRFSQELNVYLDLLIDRGSMFFCCAFNDGSLNIESMRQKVIVDAMDQCGTTDMLLGFFENDVIIPNQLTNDYYSVSFEFVYFWQLYYDDILRRMKTLLDRPCAPHLSFFEQSFSNSWVKRSVDWNVLRKACIEKSFRVASELREEYEKKYLKNYVHPVEKKLFLKDHTNYSERTLDLVLVEKIFPSRYADYVAKSKRDINKVLAEDELNVDESASYEWIVLKLMDGLFGVGVNFFDAYVYDNARLSEKSKLLACIDHPVLMQCHSRFYVYYNKTLFIDDCTLSHCKHSNDIYNFDSVQLLKFEKNLWKCDVYRECEITTNEDAFTFTPLVYRETPKKNYTSQAYQGILIPRCKIASPVNDNGWHQSAGTTNIYQVVELWIHIMVHCFEKAEVTSNLVTSLRRVRERWKILH